MNKNLPKVVIFQEDEKAINYRYKLPYKLNSDISVKSIEYDLDDFKNGEFKLVGPRTVEGAVYYLHPYKDDEYVHESLGELYFLKEKLQLYKTFASLLGARSIETKFESSKSEKLEIDAEGKVRVKVVKGDLGVKSTVSTELRNSIEINEKYDLQHNFNLNKNIETLRNLINELNLHHELDLKSLIDSRDSKDSGTILTSQHIKSEITSEYNNILEISAQLSSPIFSVGANFKRNLETLNRINIDVKFVF